MNWQETESSSVFLGVSGHANMYFYADINAVVGVHATSKLDIGVKVGANIVPWDQYIRSSRAAIGIDYQPKSHWALNLEISEDKISSNTNAMQFWFGARYNF